MANAYPQGDPAARTRMGRGFRQGQPPAAMIVSLVVVVLMTTARMLKSRMKRKACPEPAEGFHVRFCTLTKKRIDFR